MGDRPLVGTRPAESARARLRPNPTNEGETRGGLADALRDVLDLATLTAAAPCAKLTVGGPAEDPLRVAVGAEDPGDLHLGVPIRDGRGTILGELRVAAPAPWPDRQDARVREGLDACARIVAELVTGGAGRRRRVPGRSVHLPPPAPGEYDPVTGLPNRLFARERLRRHLAEGRDAGRVALHILGLDRFHEINEDHGHEAGDAVLRELAMRLRRQVRSGDTVARIGGDEFAIVQPHADGAEAAYSLATRLVEIVRAPIHVTGAVVRATASIGTAITPEAGGDPDTVPANANLAMRRAKAAGGDRACAFDAAADPECRRRRGRRRALAAAIDADALEVRFQPKVELATGRLAGAEALVRWFTDDDGEVTPSEFIPLAEETGLVVPMGRAVLDRACRLAAAWPDRRHVAVNLSPVQIERDDVVTTVARALDRSGLDPRRLELEITENVLVHDVGRATDVLHRLRALGVSLALDDFGTGYSSLAMIWNLPVDTLKLDRAFVRALDVDPRTVDIVAGVLAMARRLDLDTVAEGIETARQRQILRDLGCRLGQGFLFGTAAADPADGDLSRAPTRRRRERA